MINKLVRYAFIKKKSSHGSGEARVGSFGVPSMAKFRRNFDSHLPWLAGFFRFLYNHSVHFKGLLNKNRLSQEP